MKKFAPPRMKGFLFRLRKIEQFLHNQETERDFCIIVVMSCSVLCSVSVRYTWYLYKYMYLWWKRTTSTCYNATCAHTYKQIDPEAHKPPPGWFSHPGKFYPTGVYRIFSSLMKKNGVVKRIDFSLKKYHKYEMIWCSLLDVKSCNTAYQLMSL